MTTDHQPQPQASASPDGRKPGRFKTLRKVLLWLLGAFVALIILIIVIGSINAGNQSEPEGEQTTAAAPATPSETAATEAEAPASDQVTEAPAESSEATPTASPEEATESLSARVAAAALEANAVDSFQELQATSPGFWISEIEDVSAGTIRVYLQDDFTDTEQEDTARWLANMTCQNVDDLDTIVTQDTTGTDKNNFLRNLDILPACQ